MVAINGFRIDNTNANSLKIYCSSVTRQGELRKYLNDILVKTGVLIGEVIKIPDAIEYSITINKYEDIVLVVIEDNDKNKCFYLFDEELRCLSITNEEKEVELKVGNTLITNSSLENNSNTSMLVNFINYLDKLQQAISFNFSRAIVCYNLRIFDEENSKIVTEDKEFILAQPKFYKDDIRKMRLNIISKTGLRVIGFLDCVLNAEGESNFNYRGNLSFNMYSEYLNMGYERKVLGLLKNYINESPERINKVLYLAAKEDDKLISNIAACYGGKLEYEGEVPKSDPLNFIGKVKKVRVYRIG